MITITWQWGHMCFITSNTDSIATSRLAFSSGVGDKNSQKSTISAHQASQHKLKKNYKKKLYWNFILFCTNGFQLNTHAPKQNPISSVPLCSWSMGLLNLQFPRNQPLSSFGSGARAGVFGSAGVTGSGRGSPPESSPATSREKKSGAVE